jgi:hypothetical protein
MQDGTGMRGQFAKNGGVVPDLQMMPIIFAHLTGGMVDSSEGSQVRWLG